MAQTDKDNSGFKLPEPTEGATPPPPPPVTGTETGMPSVLAGLTVKSDTSSRDLLIGGGILLVLFVAFVFAKGAYANSLVGKRVPPNKANVAGWWLFIFLACVSTGVVLAAVNASKFMTLLIMGPLGVVAVVALVLMLVSGRN
jgi:hypothetical protein